MRYVIQNAMLPQPPMLHVVGCGGTGGFLAESLCRMLPKEALISLVDPDRVEEHNLLRQSFFREDVGRFKSEALAERLARQYGRQVCYSVYPFTSDLMEHRMGGGWSAHHGGLVIGCVDNAAARRALAQAVHITDWWIDAGNAEHSGQVLLGNTGRKQDLHGAFDKEKGMVHALPAPSLQAPELLVPVPGERRAPDCAERVSAGEQSPVINQVMAALVAEVVRRFLAGTLSWMGVTVDLEAGAMRPIEATPAAVARLVGLKEKQLMMPHRSKKEV